MLTNSDIDFIKSNRDGLVALRTTPVILSHYAVTDTNPYTGEPVKTVNAETVQAVVKGTGSDVQMVNGVVVQKGDLIVKFEPTVDLTNVNTLTYAGIAYSLVSIQPKGLGGSNRLTCLVRRNA